MFCGGAAKIGGERGRGDSGKMKEPQTNSAISLLQYAPAISYRLRKCWNDKVFKAIKYFLGCVYSKALFPVCDCKYSKYNQCTASCFFPKQKCVSSICPLLRPLGGQTTENSRDTNHAEEKTKSRPKSFPSSLLSVYSPESITHSTKKPPSPLLTRPPAHSRRKVGATEGDEKAPNKASSSSGRINVAAGKETF